MSTSDEKPEEENLNDGEKQKPLTDLQRNVKLIESWYQSYYLWNTSYFYSSCLQHRPVAPLSTYHIVHSPSASPHFVFRSTYVLNNNNINNNLLADARQQQQQRSAARRGRGDEEPHLQVYKVPSLGRRFCAELLDAFYIQIIKIIIAIALLNYTDIL